MSRLSMAIGVLAASALIAGTLSYQKSVQKWQQARDRKLRAPDSWLTLVGLFWLRPGNNTIGSTASSEFKLPKDSAPGFSATIKLTGTRASLVQPDHSERPLSYDEEKPDVVHAGSISFYVIQRGNLFGVRVKDSNSPALKSFHGMKYFPINPAFHFQARFLPDAKKIRILNVLGTTELQDSPGTVEFTYRQKQYQLRPIFEGQGKDKTLFFLFKDATNKTETYQAGRMLNTPLPRDGKVDLDFNHSYNPPCTFTPYATCPLPPKENMLPFPVSAGELRYGNGHVEYAER